MSGEDEGAGGGVRVRRAMEEPPKEEKGAADSSAVANHDPPHGDSNNEEEDDDILYEESYRPPFLWALVLAPPMLPLFWTYRVRVTETTLRFGYTYGITSKTTPRSLIRSVQLVPHVRGLRDWGGWGIRGNWSNGQFEWGYISKNGPGIRVTLAPDIPKSITNHMMSEGSESSPTPPGAKDDVEEGSLASYTFLCDDADRVAKILSSTLEEAK